MYAGGNQIIGALINPSNSTILIALASPPGSDAISVGPKISGKMLLFCVLRTQDLISVMYEENIL